MTDTSSAVFVDTERVFDAAADVRIALSSLGDVALAAPSAHHATLTAALASVAESANGFVGVVGPSIEWIARALTVGAIDTDRADQGD